MALINDRTIEVDAVISVTGTCLIKITDDKLENILNIHVTKLKKGREWLAALSFSVSTLLVLLTADFKEKWGIHEDGWRMLFILIFAISIIYLCYTIYNSLTHKVTAKSIVIDIKSRNSASDVGNSN